MSDSTLRELLASGRGSCSAGEDGSVLQRLVDLVRKLPFDLHDCQLDALEAALTESDFVVRMGTERRSRTCCTCSRCALPQF